MAVDDEFKRASATSILNPFMPTTYTDGNAGVDADERAAVSWMYSGITVANPAAVTIAAIWHHLNKNIGR